MSLESRRKRTNALLTDTWVTEVMTPRKTAVKHARALATIRALWVSRRRLQGQVAGLRAEREVLRTRVNELAAKRNPDDEVLVEGSWFHPDDLPRILGNHMRGRAEEWRRFKEWYIELEKARARIAELEEDRDACRRAAQTWLSVVERQCRDVLDATGMHDIIDESGDGDWALVWERIATMGADLRTAQARIAELEEGNAHLLNAQHDAQLNGGAQ